MKKLSIILALLLITVPVFSATDDIVKVEIKPDVVMYRLDTVKFLVFTQTCEVTYRKVDAEGNSVGEEVVVAFMNVADNPETPEDETLTEFTQLITFINENTDIKKSITTAVKLKMNIQ